MTLRTPKWVYLIYDYLNILNNFVNEFHLSKKKKTKWFFLKELINDFFFVICKLVQRSRESHTTYNWACIINKIREHHFFPSFPMMYVDTITGYFLK